MSGNPSRKNPRVGGEKPFQTNSGICHWCTYPSIHSLSFRLHVEHLKTCTHVKLPTRTHRQRQAQTDAQTETDRQRKNRIKTGQTEDRQRTETEQVTQETRDARQTRDERRDRQETRDKGMLAGGALRGPSPRAQGSRISPPYPACQTNPALDRTSLTQKQRTHRGSREKNTEP